MKSEFKPAVYAFVLLVSIVSIGIIGYMIIEGFSFIESFFMTIITVATVGFQEVHPLSDVGRIFTAFLIIFSFGIFAYAVTTFTRYIIDGIFRNYYKDNKVKKRIRKLSNHVIICGYGRNGKQAAVNLREHKEDFVIIEKNESLVQKIREDESLLYVEGDAANDEILEAAKLESARALIATLPNDAENLYIVLTARQLNPNLVIVSRASDDHSVEKLKRAGATNVIMPDKIGGQRMAKLVAEPDLVEFIEYLMLQSHKDVSLEEVSCEDIAVCFANKSIKELDIRNVSGANIIGLKREDKSFIISPSPEIKLSPGDQLFALGKHEQIERLKSLIEKGK
ncbi:MAG: potassium channel protein [Bacteroidales bacterium]|nr:potassium channel protein [Bacteroidales bacterium]